MDGLARKFFQTVQWPDALTRQRELGHRAQFGRSGEVDLAEALLGGGEIARREVPAPLDHAGNQLVAGGRQHDHRDRPVMEFAAVFPVEELLEVAHQLGSDSALLALVVEVEGPAGGNENADGTLLEHHVEVAEARLERLAGRVRCKAALLCGEGERRQCCQQADRKPHETGLSLP